MSLWNLEEGRKKADRMTALRKIVDTQSMGKVEGVSMDMTTANMLVKVHDALSAANQKKFLSLPLRQMVNLGWKLVK